MNLFTTILYSVLFINDQIGFVTGAPSKIIKTTNGGDSWYQINQTGLLDTLGAITKAIFISNTTGWAINNYPGAVLKTTDSGENWFTQFIHPASGFTGMSFSDSLNGWVSGTRPQHTTDGGLTWTQQENQTLWLSDDFYFINSDTGWMAKNYIINPSLFKTTDGGNTWLAILDVIDARKFRFTPDPNHWLIFGFDRYYMTYNNGDSWYEFTNDVPTGLTSFSAPTNQIGYAVGSLGLVLKFNDTTYVPEEFTSFTSSVNGNDVTLNWETATETNNNGFQIERLKTQNERSEEWVNLDFVNGKGTTTEPQSYSYIDEKLSAGKYQYRLKQIDFDGTFEYSSIIEVEIGTPSAYYISQNYPNPFNPSTTIKYDLPKDGLITLEVYDILGRKIATLINENRNAGRYGQTFDASSLTSGIYVYKLQADDFISSKKMILLK